MLYRFRFGCDIDKVRTTVSDYQEINREEVISISRIVRKDIQLLRGFAVLAVILFHLFPKVFHNGYLGVDIFFVISGYVVTPKIIDVFKHHSRKEILKNLLVFYKIRYYRLAPTLAIVLIFFSLVTLIIGPLQEQRFSSAQGISALLFSANLYAARVSANNYFQPNPNSFLHTWSLSAEEQIYFLVPIVIFCLYPIVKQVKKIMITVTIISYLMYISLLGNLSFLPTEISHGALYYSLIFRLWEFGLGSCLSVIDTKNSKFTGRGIFFVPFILLILSPFSSAFVFPEVACFISLLYLNNRFEINEKFAGNKMLIWMGNRSYSLYLVHLPVTFILNHLTLLIDTNIILLGALSLVITLILGNFFWKNFEQNYRITDDKKPLITTKKSLIVFTIMPLVMMLVLRVGAVNYYFLTSSPDLQGTVSCPARIDGVCTNNIVNSKRTVLLIGDSHAAAISRMFNSVLSDANINGLVISGRGCQIFERVELLLDGGCRDYRIQVIKYLEMHPGTEVLLFQRSSSIEFNTIKNDSLYMRGVFRGLQQIKSYASKVYVLGPNPEFPPGFSQGTFLGLFSNEGYFERDKMVRNSFYDGNYFLKTLGKNGIRYFDTSEIFCNYEKCKYKHKNKFLYWDENHLSLDGAEFLRSAIVKLLEV